LALKDYDLSMQIFKLFTAHPHTVGESYGEHLVRATCFGTRMIFAGLACMLHGLLPFVFVSTGSRTIGDLNEQLIAKRSGAVASRALRVDLLKH
jgi:hypothetical protein